MGTYRKNVRRTIKETMARFVAIFAIVALGVGFLAGLLSATPDMRTSFDRFFDRTGLYDVEILSGLGFTDGDVSALKALDGVEAVQRGYIADALLTTGGNEFVARMRSYDENAALNKPDLVSGRFPQSADECVIVNVFFGASATIKLGDTIKVSENDKNAADFLQSKQFKVVGFVNYSPNFSSEKEYTNVGSGTVDLFLLAPESSFAQDCWTDMFLTVKGAKALTALTPDYEDLVAGKAVEVERIAPARCQIRYEAVKSSAGEKLAKADADYAAAAQEANDKLAAAKKKLAGGAAKIKSSEAQLAEGKTQLAAKEKELASGESQLSEKQADAGKQVAAAQEKISQAQKQIGENRASVDKSLANRAQELAGYGLTAAQRDAFSALRALPAKDPGLVSEFESIQKKTDRVTAIDDRLAEINEYPEDQQGPFAEEKQSLLAEKQQLQSDLASIRSGAGYQAFAAGTQQLAATGAPSYILLANLALKLGALDAASAQITAAQKQLDSQSAALETQKTAAEKELSSAGVQIEEGKAALAEAKATLAKNENQLEAAKVTLARSEEDYGNAKFETEKKLADAKETLIENRKKIEELAVPKWTVSSRADNISCASLKSNIDKVDSIARVFPFFFFLVAALVALTTMTRMVEEERLQIGTMKALGYSQGAIMGKYLSYALLASICGSIAGFLVGYRLFPTVIWNAYTMMYTLPDFQCVLIWPYALGTSGAVIACILLATALVCRSTLKEKPAQLMLPKAPEPGKRVLLERITPIWSRMKFTHKVTARNLFRYKKRFAMTVIGVAGCTALLVTGLGLRDSFSEVSERQYSEICTYDTVAILSGDNPLQNEKLQTLLGDESQVSSYAAVNYQSMTAKTASGDVDLYTFVPEDCANLDGFVHFRERASGKELAFESGSVILTEKASEVLKVKVGGSFTLTDANGNSGTFQVTGICENYIRNFVYMDEATYKASMGQDADRNALTVKLASNDAGGRARFGKAVLATGAAGGVWNAADARGAVEDELGNIDYIVYVIILCAAMLAFVVLYNLTNINIEERVKEIATLKVLGFTDRETRAYIARESLVLAAIGCAIGLVLGVFLHHYVMGRAEMEIIMFGRRVFPLSFVIAAALTMAFSVLVDLIMDRKLKKISMVESMKAPE